MGAFEDFFQNDVANALNPNRNGVGDFFKNDVKGFITHDVGDFFKGTVGPLAKNILDTFSQALLMPMQLMNKLMTAGMNTLNICVLT